MSQSQSQTRTKGAPAKGRPPRPTTARGPRSGLAISLALHVGLIGATYLTWHQMLAPPEETHAVPVDLVTIARETNVAAQAPPPEKITIPKPTIDQPALPQFATAEPAPEPPLPKIKIQPDKSEKDDTDAAKKPTNQDFAALLNKLTAAQTPPKNAKTGTRTVQGIGNANLMTASLVDALRSQIARCWNVGAIVGGPNAADLVVDFQVQLDRNGRVASLGLSSGSAARAATNPYTQAAAQAASRAIYECQPYQLPPDRYSEWSEINPFRFDPRQMMNQ
jgi:colicin import membrane protein